MRASAILPLSRMHVIGTAPGRVIARSYPAPADLHREIIRPLTEAEQAAVWRNIARVIGVARRELAGGLEVPQ